jgi:hypothetical protein
MIKKLMLFGMVIALLAAALPFTSVYAAPLGNDPNPDKGKDAYPRVEKAFGRVKEWYNKQDEFIARSGEFIRKAETLIAKAKEKGLDASAVQSALDVFAGSIPAVQAAHDRAGAIISAHKGFDGNGKVTDIKLATKTVKDAAAALQEGRQAHLGKGKTLAEAIRAFIKANKPQRSNDGSGAMLPLPNDL